MQFSIQNFHSHTHTDIDLKIHWYFTPPSLFMPVSSLKLTTPFMLYDI